MHLDIIIPSVKLILKQANGSLLADLDTSAVIHLFSSSIYAEPKKYFLSNQTKVSLVQSLAQEDNIQTSKNYSKCKMIWGTILKIKLICFAVGVVNILSILLSLSIAFYGKHLVQNLKDTHTSLDIFMLFGVILALKLSKSIIQMLQSYLQTMLGLGFYYYFLYQSMTKYSHSYYKNQKYGRVINFLEDDSEKIIFLPYVFVQMVSIILQIVACAILLVFLVGQSYFIIAGLMVFLLTLCTVICYSSYKINETLMHSKDYRITANFNIDMKRLSKYRGNELFKIKLLFLLELAIKVINQIFYTLFFLLLVWQLYNANLSNIPIILTILNILRGNIQKVFYYGPLFFSSYNSFQRMVITLNTIDQIGPSQEKKFKQDQVIVDIQKGQIQFRQIYQLLLQNSSSKLLLFLLLGLLVFTCMLGAYNMDNYKQIFLDKQIHTLRILVYVLVPIILCILIFSTISMLTLSFSYMVSEKMVIIQADSKKKIANKNKNANHFFDRINKLSGDLRALDKSLCLNCNDFLFEFSYFLSSIVYTGYLLFTNWWVQIIYVLFIVLIVWYVFKLNRYIMRARRDYLRTQCNYKRSLIQELFSNKNRNRKHSELTKILAKILQYKYLGFVSQSLAITIIMLLFALFSSLILAACMLLDTDTSSLLVLYTFFMQSDLDIYFIFVAAIRTQLSLVSVQRVINNLFPGQKK